MLVPMLVPGGLGLLESEASHFPTNFSFLRHEARSEVAGVTEACAWGIKTLHPQVVYV